MGSNDHRGPSAETSDADRPYFLKTINYCMEAFAIGITDTEDAVTHATIIKEALGQFIFELQYRKSSK